MMKNAPAFQSQPRMPKNRDSRRDRLLREAEGYLELQMPAYALEALDRIENPGDAAFNVSYLRGMAYREQRDHAKALVEFTKAGELEPDNIALLLAMAWCFKRVDQIPQSIAMLDRAYKIAPKEALILYNLSCYWSLLGNKTQALSWLGRALRLDGSFRDLIADESDFDSLRHDPDFQLVIGKPGEVV